MSILITGATGFLGSYLVKEFINENEEVVIIKRSFSDTNKINKYLGKVKIYDLDRKDLEEIFECESIDRIIHVATCYGREGESLSQLIEANIVFPIKLAELGMSYGVKIFYNTDTLQNDNLNAYTLSKTYFRECIKRLFAKMKIVNVRIEFMYGENDSDTKFVNWFLNKLISNEKEIKLTAGVQKRDFVYVTDVVSAYMNLIKQSPLQNVTEFEIGTGKSISVKDFCLKVVDSYERYGENSDSKLNFGAIYARQGEPNCIQANISAMEQRGWEPKYSFDEGIDMFVGHSLQKNKAVG